MDGKGAWMEYGMVDHNMRMSMTTILPEGRDGKMETKHERMRGQRKGVSTTHLSSSLEAAVTGDGFITAHRAAPALSPSHLTHGCGEDEISSLRFASFR